MFCKRQQENLERSIPDPFADKVKCETCKCWVDKKDAQIQSGISFMGRYSDYYCQAHKKPYDRMINCFPPIYLKELSVDENGEPVGYIKIKEKQNDNNTRAKN